MDANIRKSIKGAINGSPRNGYVVELHAQILKHAAALQNVNGEDFCAQLEIPASYGTEYRKMMRLAQRLSRALDPTRI